MEEKKEVPDELRKTSEKSEEIEDQVKVESTGASKRKMSRSSDEEHERGRKRMKMCSEEHVRDPGLKRLRTADDEEQHDSKRAKLSSSRKLGLQTDRKSDVKDQQSRGQKRSREPDDDNEPERKMLAKTSSSGMHPTLDKQKIDMKDQQRRGQKRSREPDDDKEPERQKLAKASSFGKLQTLDEQKIAQTPSLSKPAQKRSRESEEEEERITLKKAKISSLPPQDDCVAGGSKQILDDSTTSLSHSITDYWLLKTLGKGSYGMVKLALHKSTNQTVAIKLINKAKSQETFIQMEQRILQKTQGCPFLCHGLTSFQTPALAVMVMEHIEGGCLQSLLAQKGSLQIDESRFVAAELICGIQFLHMNGIIHRDLKPANILLDKEGHVKIIDFGLAAENVSFSEKVKGRFGTAYYMAPEVLSDEAYNQSADWWAFGMLLCRMLTGKLPYSMEVTREVYRMLVLHTDPTFPDWLDGEPLDLLNRLLDKNPISRLEAIGRIREHDFFKEIDWKELESRNVRPPYQI
uniref:Protein kinase domain-containing protein n=1 Tax=Leptobrachium leishanense TaxID=445787 RepID=A0A8C5Q948_9ANUR